MILQIPTDPETLGTVSQYLPVFTILALGFFSFYMVKIFVGLYIEERKASTQSIERMSKAVDELNANMISSHKELLEIVKDNNQEIKERKKATV
jgi:hypothetical protein